MQQHQQLELIKRLKALADTGLVYAKDDYDRERYEELKETFKIGQEVTVISLSDFMKIILDKN